MRKDTGYRYAKPAPKAKKRAVSSRNQLPQKVDLRKFLTRVEDQLGNSCVANACAGAYEYLAKRDLGQDTDVSRLFVYYNARLFDESEYIEDDGTTIQSAINGLKEYGACFESLWPNSDEYINEEPPEEAYSNASQFVIEEEEYLDSNLELWKQTLADGHPIIFSLNTFESFDNCGSNKGRVTLPRRGERLRETHGWHAMLCVGYSEPDQFFIVRNSWGPQWGDKGYCYIPYTYMMDDELNGADSWIIKSVSNTDYMEDISDDSEEAYFELGENVLVLRNAWITVVDPDLTFEEEFDALLNEFATAEEEFYVNWEEVDYEDGTYQITFLNFEIDTEDHEAFLEALDALFAQYALNEEEFDYVVEVEGD